MSAIILNLLTPTDGLIIILMKRVDSRYLWAAAIFAISLALRLAYFFQVKANFPGWDSPTIDPLYHDLWAKQIAAGDLLGSGPFFRAPFYAYFLGLIYAIFGASLAAAKIIQHALGALTCSVIFLFADRYFGRKVAILTAILTAFNWVMIYHEDELLLDSLLALFSVAIIWRLLRSTEKPSFGSFFISGLWLGLACITRPNYLAIFPAIFIWILLLYRLNLRKSVIYMAATVAGAAIFIAPVTARNMIIGKDTVLIASQGGINFYIGNNIHADGATAAIPEFGSTWQYSDAEYLAQSDMGRLGERLKQSEVSSFYYGRGFDFIRSHPAKWLGLMLRKLDYFWNAFEISNNQNLYFYRRFASVTSVLPPLFWLISPLSLMGLYLITKLPGKFLIIPIFVITYMLTVIAFFVTSRFRLPVLPFLIILASLTLLEIYDSVRARNFRKSAIMAVIILALYILTSFDFYGISKESYAMSHFSLGNVYLKKGLRNKALEEYTLAIEMEPCVPKAHLNRGVIYFGYNDYQRAEREFSLELEKCRISPEAHNNLSVLMRLTGRHGEALEHAREAIAQKPNYPEAILNEILALRMLREDSQAVASAANLVSLFPDFSPGHYYYGKLLSESGQFELARQELKTVLDQKQGNIVERYDLSTIYASQAGFDYRHEGVLGLANYELGLIEVKSGIPALSLGYFKRATELIPDNAEAWINLALAYDSQRSYPEALEAFKRGIELAPSTPLGYYNLGLTLGKIGQLSDAADCFRQALDLKPDLLEAREKLKLTEAILNSPGKK